MMTMVAVVLAVMVKEMRDAHGHVRAACTTNKSGEGVSGRGKYDNGDEQYD